jgi:hypothetical protein
MPYLAVGISLYGFQSAWSALISYQAVMIGVVLYTSRSGCLQPLTGVPLMSQYWVMLTAVTCLLAGPLVYALWPWLSPLPTLTPLLVGWGLSGQHWAVLAIYFCLSNPWLEELYWRSCLSRQTAGLAGTDIWFAGYHGLVLFPILHWPWLLVALGFLGGASWWWRRLTHYSGSLAGAILTHAIADASLMLAVSLLR